MSKPDRDVKYKAEEIEKVRGLCENFMAMKESEVARKKSGDCGIGLKMCNFAQLQFPRSEKERARNRFPVR